MLLARNTRLLIAKNKWMQPYVHTRSMGKENKKIFFSQNEVGV